MSAASRKTRRASPQRDRLVEVREKLLNLHKALIDFERVRYEASFGVIPSPNQFLQLLMQDSWFAWLHPLSQLIVAMDEAIEEKTEMVTVPAANALIAQLESLLTADEDSEGFSGNYFSALQEEPDVVLAHAAVKKAIGPKKPPGGA
jgi:hypothetical protein